MFQIIGVIVIKQFLGGVFCCVCVVLTLKNTSGNNELAVYTKNENF